MAINIKFDLAGNPEPPTIILANRNGNQLGQLLVDADSIDLIDKFNNASELTFTLNKYIDGELTPLWEKVVDFKLIFCREWNMWFEIRVELDEATESIKTVFCTQLGQAELSQIKLYDIEINTEADIERDDYKISILYDEDDPEASILHRMLEKAPHYSIVHVDPTIAGIQRSFSFDDTSICDAFNEIAEEIGCLFVYNSNSDEHGKIQRTISVYDLQQNCKDCGHRTDVFADKCEKCGSVNIQNGYGDDTLIFVTSDELAADGIQLVTDTDAVKNCFKLEAGDDLMTATIRNCNPNGTDYIWYFSDSVKEDMSNELVEKIESYDEMYKEYYETYVSNLDAGLLNKYNSYVNKYSTYRDDLESIAAPITSYSALMNAYYNVIDLALYLKSGLMPTVKMSDTSATEQAGLLTSSSMSPVSVANLKTVSAATANCAVLSMAKVIVRPTYKVEIQNPDSIVLTNNGSTKTWSGKFIITNYSDEEDTAISNTVSITINDDLEKFINQKIEKALNKENTDDLSIAGLFKKEYDDFCAELKKYALNPLKSFRESCEVCLSILQEQGVANSNTWASSDSGSESNLYEKIYLPYFNKLKAIESEISIREKEVNDLTGTYNQDGKLVSEGLQTNIEKCKNEIQEVLDFEKYLGPELLSEFCAYRREDKYSNENYISDGLNNAEIFEKALEFFEVAKNEIYKSAELQHSISTTLKNLLAIKKFKVLVDSFRVGNWIRVGVDDYIYKLRLLEYQINFGSFDNIPVEFSDVTKVKNGYTDINDVLSQASSMASSYSAIQRQANQGSEAKDTINEWLVDGLNSALVQIKSNNDEYIELTKSGLWGRTKDVTGEWHPEQFKLTHNIMAYTNDNWKTVSAALGKHEYTRWGNNGWIKDVGYGLSANFVTAGYISGSQIVGGEIISSNYYAGDSDGSNKRGTYFDLINGDFEIGDGKISYNKEDGKLVLQGVDIQWSSTNAPIINVENITGMEDYINDVASLRDQLDSNITTWFNNGTPTLYNYPASNWTTDALKEQHLDDLYYDNLTGCAYRFVVNNSVYYWQIMEDSAVVKALSDAAKAQDTADGKRRVFVAIPIPPYDVGDLWVQGETGDIMRCQTARGSGEQYRTTDWVKASKYTDDSALQTFISGDYADDLDDIRGQVDGKADTWYQAEDPSEAWTDTETKELHKGDLWFETDNAEEPTKIWNGEAWEVQSVPKEVFDKIDGKSQIFVNQPMPPYNVGDLWVQGSTGDIMRCQTARGSGEQYNNADWVKASKYTDDSSLDDFINNKYETDLENTNDTINRKYNDAISTSQTMLNDYKADVGQWMTWNSNGLTLGAQNSPFSTILDNQSLRFQDSGTTVAYISNKQLNIESAIIRNSLIFGKFFFCPREDGSVSISWQN